MKGVVRERAAHELDCSEDDIEIEEIGGTSYVAAGCGSSGTYTCSDTVQGMTAICVRDDPPGSAHDDSASARRPDPAGTSASPSSAKPATDPPAGAAGFEFGAKGRAVRSACTDAGLEWTALGGTKYRCNGVPKSMDLADASTELWFCKGSLCGIFVSGKATDESRWTPTAVGLFESLIAKYGQPAERDVRIPASCTKQEGPDCIAAGQASLRVTWSWPTAQRIELFVGIADGSPAPIVRLSYTSPRSAGHAEGL